MIASLVITLREGLEAALIIGIILAYLSHTDSRRGFKPVWIGIGLALLVSLIAGAVIYLIAGELSGRSEQIFEGLAMFLAAGILTWMILWMRKQAVDIKAHLHAQIESMLSGGSLIGLATLAFFAVVREGIETVLFLFATNRISQSNAAFISGGLVGLVIAFVLGYSIYKGTSRLNLRAFFNITGILLIFFSAGLLVNGIHEFHEASIIPTVIEHIWNINNVLSEDSTFGLFLKAVFGYNGNPSLVEVIAYISYLGLALTSYFRLFIKNHEMQTVA